MEGVAAGLVGGDILAVDEVVVGVVVDFGGGGDGGGGGGVPEGIGL